MTAAASLVSRMGWTAHAAAGLGGAMVIIGLGNYNVPHGENGGTGPAIFTAILCTVLTAGLFGFLARRARPTRRAAVVLGAASVLSLLAFWSGITPVLAAANLALTSGREGLGKPAAVARILGVIAALAAIAVTIAGSHVF